MSKSFLAVLTSTYNEAPLVPWFLRYYENLADKIIVHDDHSTDGTRELLAAHPLVELHDWRGDNGIDEEQRLSWSYDCKKAMVGQCHWLMVVDFDEFIFGPHRQSSDVLKVLKEEEARGTDVIQTSGFNMMYQHSPDGGVPAIKGHQPTTQLWHLIPTGVYAPVYSKPVVIRPEAKVDWHRGRHQLNECDIKLSLKPRLKLLHFRFLSPSYTRARNARNMARCCARTGDKGAAWSCDPKRDSAQQEGTSLWTARAQRECFNVIEMPI